MNYITELHCHSREGSGCSNESPEGIVKKYIDAGYTTVCLTNHLKTKPEHTQEKWEKIIEEKYHAYDLVVRAAGDKLTVLLGFEVYIESTDHLLFGFDKEYLLTHHELFYSSLETFSNQVRADGMYFIQAHPFRPNNKQTDPALLDAIEVYNGHPEHQSHNELAEEWARKHGKTMVSGTDHHDTHHIPNGGILTDVPVTDIPTLIRVLKSKTFTPIIR